MRDKKGSWLDLFFLGEDIGGWDQIVWAYSKCFMIILFCTIDKNMGHRKRVKRVQVALFRNLILISHEREGKNNEPKIYSPSIYYYFNSTWGYAKKWFTVFFKIRFVRILQTDQQHEKNSKSMPNLAVAIDYGHINCFILALLHIGSTYFGEQSDY